jgi:hypothetical protein
LEDNHIRCKKKNPIPKGYDFNKLFSSDDEDDNKEPSLPEIHFNKQAASHPCAHQQAIPQAMPPTSIA